MKLLLFLPVLSATPDATSKATMPTHAGTSMWQLTCESKTPAQAPAEAIVSALVVMSLITLLCSHTSQQNEALCMRHPNSTPELPRQPGPRMSERLLVTWTCSPNTV